MARNEEKLFGRLNRLHLQKQRDAELAKNPKRPALCTLNSAPEVRKWLGTISRDLDLALKQLAVPCYPERVIGDVKDNIARLEKDYKQFNRKLRELDPTSAGVSSDKRTYCQQKRNHDALGCDHVEPATKQPMSNHSMDFNVSDSDKFVTEFLSARLKLPVLDGEIERRFSAIASERVTTETRTDFTLQDCPLDFRPIQTDAVSVEMERTNIVASTGVGAVVRTVPSPKLNCDAARIDCANTGGLSLLAASYADSSDEERNE